MSASKPDHADAGGSGRNTPRRASRQLKPRPKGIAGVKQSLLELLRQKDGKLTRDLLLSPGGYGLGMVPDKRKPDATTTMVCGFCSTGCALNIHLKQGEAINLTPSSNYPVNLGMACPKGWEALRVLNAPDRATSPLLRNKKGDFEAVGWDAALKTFCAKFKDLIAKHGPDSVAFISTGQIPFEEMLMLGALARFGMGFKNGDSNTRQCMATSAVAYKESFGFDAPPYTFADFEASDVLFFIGSNLAIAHPIMWERVMRNPHKPKIIVLDPRHTETAICATLHAPLLPKSDLQVLYGIAHILFKHGWVNREYIAQNTEGVEGFEQHVAAFTPEKVSAVSGLSEQQLQDIARLLHEGKRVSFWWTMGVNQGHESVRTAQAVINLALLTGNIGRPGTGANSVTGQCNAMGSRLYSITSNLPGGRDFANAKHRREIADFFGIESALIPEKSGATYNEIIDGACAGKIKGLWIIGTNTAHSWINQDSILDARKNLEFLCVQDMYHSTESAQLADLVLPAAGWGEKDGAFINSERRLGVLKKVSRAPGQALADFAIFKLIAHYWGCEQLLARWNKPEDVFQFVKMLSKGRPCDITGVPDYNAIDQQGGVQWPCPEGAFPPEQERRLFADGKFYTATQKAKFCYEAPRPLPEPTCAEYPFTMLTGRGTASQWHTQTRTSKSPVLRKLYPAHVYVEINPDDAAKRGIKDQAWVGVVSRRGRFDARAHLSAAVAPGQIFAPMHYSEVNRLTFPAFDPYSKQPSYKACAVRLDAPRKKR